MMANDKFSRQTFLGAQAEYKITNCRVGIVGLGGGGSHIVQQLAHIGFKNFVIYDADVVEASNLNRLVGATCEDARLLTPKIEVAMRLIKGLQPDAIIEAFQKRWQQDPFSLRQCDIVFGCVDGFAERRELEICTRRYLIPLIDIGVDVHSAAEGQPPVMSGQVILSMPGGPCLTCMNFLNENNLAKENALYGVAGIRPQVVWANGVLASTAVGISVDLLTGWTKSLPDRIIYLSFDSNLGLIKPHPRTHYISDYVCNHFSEEDVGDPIFERII